jgi:hypothetical protein
MAGGYPLPHHNNLCPGSAFLVSGKSAMVGGLGLEGSLPKEYSDHIEESFLLLLTELIYRVA